jgi:hypothetical protein
MTLSYPRDTHLDQLCSHWLPSQFALNETIRKAMISCSMCLHSMFAIEFGPVIWRHVIDI